MLPRNLTNGFYCNGAYLNDDGERFNNWQENINNYTFQMAENGTEGMVMVMVS